MKCLYTEREGGYLLPLENGPTILAALDLVAEKANRAEADFIFYQNAEKLVHSFVFPDGTRWDCINGINEKPKGDSNG